VLIVSFGSETALELIFAYYRKIIKLNIVAYTIDNTVICLTILNYYDHQVRIKLVILKNIKRAKLNCPAKISEFEQI